MIKNRHFYKAAFLVILNCFLRDLGVVAQNSKSIWTPVKDSSIFGEHNRTFQALSDLVGIYYCENHTLEILPNGNYFCRFAKGPGFGGPAELLDGYLMLTIAEIAQPWRRVKYIPVRWSDRLYLVDNISDFRKDIAEGKEPRANINGRYYLRAYDWLKKTSGPPDLQDSRSFPKSAVPVQ